jgi:hypothetical protein
MWRFSAVGDGVSPWNVGKSSHLGTTVCPPGKISLNSVVATALRHMLYCRIGPYKNHSQSETVSSIVWYVVYTHTHTDVKVLSAARQTPNSVTTTWLSVTVYSVYFEASAYFTHPDFSAAKLEKKSAQITRVNMVVFPIVRFSMKQKPKFCIPEFKPLLSVF